MRELPDIAWPCREDVPPQERLRIRIRHYAAGAAVEVQYGCVDVWICNIDHSIVSFEALSADEISRANRIRDPVARVGFIASRGTLRALVARLTGCSATDVELSYDMCGRPALAGSDIDFSITRRDGIALVAITRGARVGVDVENLERLGNIDSVVEMFSHAERQSIRGLSGQVRYVRFAEIWTAKEAWAKAEGCGIAKALTACDTTTLAPADLATFQPVGNAVASVFLQRPSE